MCYNCGCGMPDDDHGNPKNITNQTFQDAAKASNTSSDDAKRYTKELLENLEATKGQDN